MSMNRRDRRRYGKRGDGVQRVALSPTHARVLMALYRAGEGVRGEYFHEAQLAADLGMSIEDVRRYLRELTFWGLVEKDR